MCIAVRGYVSFVPEGARVFVFVFVFVFVCFRFIIIIAPWRRQLNQSNVLTCVSIRVLAVCFLSNL